MRKIESVLPEAHFIHLIRDGRDVTEHMHRYLAAKAKAASGERVLA